MGLDANEYYSVPWGNGPEESANRKVRKEMRSALRKSRDRSMIVLFFAFRFLLFFGRSGIKIRFPEFLN